MIKLMYSAGVVLACCAAASAANSTVVGFDGGSNGGFMGNAFFEAAGGNPGGRAHHQSPSLFFSELRTGAIGEPSNPAFLGDYSGFSSVTFSFDVRVDLLQDFLGNPGFRDVGIMLIDRDIQGTDGDSGVYTTVGLLSENLSSWTTLSTTITDTTSASLPAGWVGFGSSNQFFEPILPVGATFATVLAGVDEFRITGAVPGFFFSDLAFDVSIDNITVNAVPAPASMGLLGLAGIGASRRRRSA